MLYLSTSDPADFLEGRRTAVLESAAEALRHRVARHYAAAGDAETQERLERLYDRVMLAVATRNAGAVVAYAVKIAEERFYAGYDLSEVQAAFNALEEAIWADAFAQLPPRQYAAVIGLVSSVVGAARDALARRYVTLATNEHVPSLDVQALFAGTDRA